MQKRDENSQPIGIRQRFVNFMFSILSHTTSRQSVEVPIEEGLSINNGKSSIRPSRTNGSSAASEIVVEFRHIVRQENWETRVDDYGSPIHVPKKDASSLADEQLKGASARFPVAEKFNVKTRDNGLQEQGRSQELNPASIKWQKNGFRRKESKDSTNLLAEGTKMVKKPNDETNPMPSRRPWLLVSVPSNINEKAESFIKSRKEAMARSFDPKID